MNTSCKCFFSLWYKTVEFFVPAIHAHKHRFNQLFYPIIQSTIWGSVLHGTVFNTQECTVQHYEPQKSIHWLHSVLYALSPDRTGGMMLGFVFFILFSFIAMSSAVMTRSWTNCFLNCKWITLHHVATVLENNF
jgi:hypothetical protein